MTSDSVLLVDPDLTSALTLARQLTECGYEVDLAFCESAGIAQARARLYPVILMAADPCDPASYPWIRALHLAAPRTWLLLMTHHAPDEANPAAHAAGADGIVGLPVDVADLVRRVRGLCLRPRPPF